MWLLQSFDFSFEMVDAQDSMMAVIGHYLAPVFAPLGFDSWQTAFAAITGFLAKEVVVSHLVSWLELLKLPKKIRL